MIKKSLKILVYEWMEQNRELYEGQNMTLPVITMLLFSKNPDFVGRYQEISAEKYVGRFLRGDLQYSNRDRNDEIKEQIMANREVAREAFTPSSTSINVDLDPLGVLRKPDDISKIFFDIPETYAKHQSPLKLDGYGKKMGIISDIHFPIHDRPAVMAAHAHLKAENIDCLLLLGDIMDTSNLTRHAHRQSLSYTWREELEVARAYIKSLRILFPNIPIVYHFGNHESWMTQYLVRQASQLEGEYLLQERLKFEEFNIEYVDEFRLMTYGHLFLHHGHMLGISGGRNVATRILDKHGVNLLVGHYHRQMTDEKTNLDGRLHAVWINGCLADQHPSYNPYGNSTHGCSIVNLSSDSTFHVSQYRILNGKVIG
jgi:predicted phosphodiesterase